MKQSIKFLLMLTLIAGVGTFYSCSDDDDNGGSLKLSSLTSGTTDLNGSTAATNVAVDMPIVATFSKDVDEASTDGIALTRTFDDADVPIAVTVVANVVTITPVNDLSGGAEFELSFTGLESESGANLSSVSRLFTTGGIFTPDDVIAHFSFENNVTDVVGAFDPTNAGIAVTYVDSYTGVAGAAGKAASFDGTTTLIEVPNGDQFMTHGDFAISFWIKTDGSKESHFVLGLAGSKGFQFEIMGGAWTALDKGVKLATQYQLATTTDGEDTWWNGKPNTWQGSTFAKDVTAEGGIQAYFKDKWANVVCTYDASSKLGTMYVNGEKVRQFDFNLWPAADAKKAATGVVYAGNTTAGGKMLALGFIQASTNPTLGDTWADYSNPANNHFKGLMDDVRIYSRAITEDEVELMYNSEKP